jgi:hypothetical protein
LIRQKHLHNSFLNSCLQIGDQHKLGEIIDDLRLLLTASPQQFDSQIHFAHFSKLLPPKNIKNRIFSLAGMESD